MQKTNRLRFTTFKSQHACSQTKHTTTHLGHWPGTRETNVALNYIRHITHVMARTIAQKRSYTCLATQQNRYCQAVAVITLTPATTPLPLRTRNRERPALQPCTLCTINSVTHDWCKLRSSRACPTYVLCVSRFAITSPARTTLATTRPKARIVHVNVRQLLIH